MNDLYHRSVLDTTRNPPFEVVMVTRAPPALGTRAGARAKALKGG